MLMIALLLVGGATPLVSGSVRALIACAVAAAGLFVAVAAAGENATETGSMIGAVGVFAIGLLLGGVAQGFLTRDKIARDRAIRRALPRELPSRYR